MVVLARCCCRVCGLRFCAVSAIQWCAVACKAASTVCLLGKPLRAAARRGLQWLGALLLFAEPFPDVQQVVRLQQDQAAMLHLPWAAMGCAAAAVEP